MVSLIEQSKLQAVLNVNKEMLALYWKIGSDILEKQEQLGWGAQIVEQLATDLSQTFPDDRGFSARNLRNMKRFAQEYPDFPFLQVPLAEMQKDEILQVALGENNVTPIWQVPLAKIEKNGDRRFSLRGFTQPMGVAEYEIKQLIEEVQNSLPNIEDIELGEDGQEYGKK